VVLKEGKKEKEGDDDKWKKERRVAEEEREQIKHNEGSMKKK
jgi:hypothetical protein